jgi:hypothetical protein
VDYLVLGPARALYEAGLKATQQEAKVGPGAQHSVCTAQGAVCAMQQATYA